MINHLFDGEKIIKSSNSHVQLSDEQINNIGSVLNFKTPLEVRAIQDKHLENDRRISLPVCRRNDNCCGHLLF